MSGERILLIDDEELIRLSLEDRLADAGYEVSASSLGTEGVKRLEEEPFDLVLLDYKLPDLDGLECLRRIQARENPPPVIMMTAYSTIESAVEAMRAGAYSYIKKPFNMEEVLVLLQRALETRTLKQEVRQIRSSRKAEFSWSNVVGQGPAMRGIFALVEKVAASGATTILIQGESGTGKDLLAKAIHYGSDRADRPFMNITCSAVPEQLLESELFGHEKGAFTDAKAAKKGLFELADGGTIFLDEIGDMPLLLQAKLLRFLEEKSFKRVGGTQDLRVEVRVIAATNCDLDGLVRDGKFRKDLYYRLKVIPIALPPLRERPDDIPALVQFFVERFSREFKKRIRGVSPDALAGLSRYPWPGNIRELRNVIERAVLLAGSETLDPHDFPLEPAAPVPAPAAPAPGGDGGFPLPASGVRLEDVERGLVEQALKRAAGNQTHAARLLGITRDQLRYRVEKFGLRPHAGFPPSGGNGSTKA